MAPRFVGHALVALALLVLAAAAASPGSAGVSCAGDAQKPYLCPDGTCAKALQNCPCVNAARVSATSVAPRSGATGVAGELDVGAALEFAAVAAFRGDSGRCAAVDFAPLTRLAFTVAAVGAAAGPLATISDVPASSQGASVATFAPGVFAAGTRYTVTATYTDLKGRASSASYTFLGVAVTTTTTTPEPTTTTTTPEPTTTTTPEPTTTTTATPEPTTTTTTTTTTTPEPTTTTTPPPWTQAPDPCYPGSPAMIWLVNPNLPGGGEWWVCYLD